MPAKYLLPLLLVSGMALAGTENLGLPSLPVPADNPHTPAKIALGGQLFHGKRFSSTGEVSCATCHDAVKGFTDSPLVTSQGIKGLRGTRNAPTVINSAFNKTQFWDGRSPDLEDQSRHPPVNPVEMGLPNHEPILEIALTAPYMHDGSLATLRDVVVHYNNGGVSKEGNPVNPYLSGGIRPLQLTDQQIDDLVAFMEALTTPRFAAAAKATAAASSDRPLVAANSGD